MNPIFLIAIAGFVLISGCGYAASSETPRNSPPPTDAARASTAPAAKANSSDYTLAIVQSDTQSKTRRVVWTARVNSGGWTLKTDKVLVEDALGKQSARVWVTLQRPAPNKIVTQAFQTLSGEYDAGTTTIERAELLVRTTTRGVNDDAPPAYTAEKTAAFPD